MHLEPASNPAAHTWEPDVVGQTKSVGRRPESPAVTRNEKLDLDQFLELMVDQWKADRDEERKTWQSVFETVDEDGNGMLDVDEFCVVRGVWRLAATPGGREAAAGSTLMGLLLLVCECAHRLWA